MKSVLAPGRIRPNLPVWVGIPLISARELYLVHQASFLPRNWVLLSHACPRIENLF